MLLGKLGKLHGFGRRQVRSAAHNQIQVLKQSAAAGGARDFDQLAFFRVSRKLIRMDYRTSATRKLQAAKELCSI